MLGGQATMAVVRELLRRWQLQGVVLRPGAEETALAAFEACTQLYCPRTFASTCDG